MPPTDEIDRLRRKTLRLAAWNGGTIIALAILCILITLPFDATSAIFLGLVTGLPGAMEIHGRNFLKRADARARLWLPLSQLSLLFVVVVYCGWQLMHVDVEIKELDSLGLGAVVSPDMIIEVNNIVYLAAILVSLCYQGGLAWLYTKRCRILTETAPPPLPPPA